MDCKKIASYFAEWEALCERDNGRLWGVNLRTPFVIINPETREAVANEPDSGGEPVSRFPSNLVISASVTEFGGKRWAMAPSILMEHIQPKNGLRIMVHEAFHCTQPDLFGECDTDPDNSHMDEADSRIGFFLEANALIKSLKTRGTERISAIQTALSVRDNRRLTYNKANDENLAELMEGTAVYTEIKINHEDDAISEAVTYADNAKNFASLAHYFGYVTGMLYCLVLDSTGTDWKKDLKFGADLGGMLMEAMDIKEFPAFDKIDRQELDGYGYSEIVETERIRAEIHEAMLKEIRDAFTEQPVLQVHEDGEKSIMGEIINLTDLGTVLKGQIEFIGDFGRMFMQGGLFLMHNDGCSMVSADGLKVEGRYVTSTYWEMELNEGFDVHAQKNGNGFLLVRG